MGSNDRGVGWRQCASCDYRACFVKPQTQLGWGWVEVGQESRLWWNRPRSDEQLVCVVPFESVLKLVGTDWLEIVGVVVVLVRGYTLVERLYPQFFLKQRLSDVPQAPRRLDTGFYH